MENTWCQPFVIWIRWSLALKTRCGENMHTWQHVLGVLGLYAPALKSLSLPPGGTMGLLIINPVHWIVSLHSLQTTVSPEVLGWEGRPRNEILVLAFLVVSKLGIQFRLSVIISPGQKKFIYNPQDLSGNQIQTFYKNSFQCMLHVGCKTSKLFWLLESQFLL